MDELNLTFCKLLIARVRLKILLLTFTIRITTQVSDPQTHWYSQRFAPCCATFLDLNFSSQTPAEHPCIAAYQGDSTDLQKTATLALCLLHAEKKSLFAPTLPPKTDQLLDLSHVRKGTYKHSCLLLLGAGNRKCPRQTL